MFRRLSRQASRKVYARRHLTLEACVIDTLEQRINFGGCVELTPEDCGSCDGNYGQHPVRYSNGGLKLKSVDIMPGGISDVAVARIWNNNKDDSNPLKPMAEALGGDWMATSVPFMAHSAAHDGQPEMAVVMFSATDRRFFTQPSSGQFQSLYARRDVLERVEVAGAYTFTYTDVDGAVISFRSGHEWGEGGKIQSRTSPSGVQSTYIWSTTDTNLVDRVESDYGSGSDFVREELVYEYGAPHDANVKLLSVTLQRRFGSTTASPVAIERVSYVYYYEPITNTSANLKKAVVERKNSAGSFQTVSEEYYRYDSGFEGAGDYGNLKFIVRPDSYARMDQAVKSRALSDSSIPDTITDIDLLYTFDGTLANELIAAYADNYFEYDGDKRVTKEIARGAGCSCGSNGGAGQYEYSYSLNANYVPGTTQTDHNKWKNKTIETFKADVGGTLKTQFTNYVYTNFAGAVVLKVYSDGANSWATANRYDESGKLIFAAEPSAVSITTADLTTSGIEANDDLLGYSTSTGGYSKLNDSSGLIHRYGYYRDESNTIGDTVAGAAKDKLGYMAEQRGDLTDVRTITSITQSSSTSVATVSGAAHAYSVGDLVSIWDASSSFYNGTFVISAVTSSTFSFEADSGAPDSLTGVTFHALRPEAITATSYFKHEHAGVSVYPTAKETRFSGTGQTGDEETSYAYTFFDAGASFGIESVVVTRPGVTVAKNGSGSADRQETTIFDEFGRTIWEKYGGGFITYTEYDIATGGVKKVIQDVDHTAVSNEPSGWTTPSGGGKHLITLADVDAFGRQTKIQHASGNVDYIVYDDVHEGGINSSTDDGHEVWTFPGWNSVTKKTAAPVTVVRQDEVARNDSISSTLPEQIYSFVDEMELTKSSAWNNDTGTGAPKADETISSLSLQSLQREFSNRGEQFVDRDRYVHFAGMTYSLNTEFGSSTGSTPNFYRDSFWYDKQGRLERTQFSTGTIKRQVHDIRGRMTSEWVGTDDTPTSGYWSVGNVAGTNMRMVAEYEFDEGGIGDGNVTRVRTLPDGSSSPRITQNFYDWRNRLVASKDGQSGKQVDRLTPSGVIEVGDKFTVTLFDETGASAAVTVTTTSTSISSLTSALTTAINAATGLFSPINATDGSSYVTLTSDNNNVAFHVTVSTVETNDGPADAQFFARTAQPMTLSEGDNTFRQLCYYEYDNLSRQTAKECFNGDTVATTDTSPADGVPDKPSSSLKRAKETTSYDEQGRVSRQSQYGVSYSGTQGNILSTDYFYDKRDNIIKIREPGNLVTKRTYDGVGWISAEYQTDGGGDASPGSSGALGAADDVDGDIVLEQREWTHDANGNIVFEKLRQRFQSATSSQTGALGDKNSANPTAKARVSYTSWFYDSADRLSADAEAGTNAGSSYTRFASTAGSGTTTTLVDSTLTGSSGDYVGKSLTIIGGTNAGMRAVITAYNSSTKELTFSPAADAAMNSTTKYTLTGSELLTGYQYASDELQSVEIFGSPTGGTFKLTYAGQETSALAYNESAANVQSALVALSNIDTGDVIVTSSTSGIYVVKFTGALTMKDVAELTATSVSLTGGTTPGLRIYTGIDGQAGGMVREIDPRGLITLHNHDRLGREAQIVEGYTDGVPSSSDDRITRSTFDGNNHVLTYKALLPAGAFQTTEYVYTRPGTDSVSGVYSNDILWAVKYPTKTGTSAGQPDDSSKEVYTRNALGEAKTFKDRNLTTHTYTYDSMGRLTIDNVTGAVGSGVDATVTKLAFDFDTAGRPQYSKSYNSSGTVLNSVLRAYNGFGQVTIEHQDHSGNVDIGTSPQVIYSYSEGASSSNHSRLTSVQYPSGRLVRYEYGTVSGNNSTTVNSSISRLSYLADDSGGSIGTHLEEYGHLGLGTSIERNRPEPGTKLTYDSGADTITGDGGDRYIGLDRFGRVVSHRWVKSGSDFDSFEYGYDQNSNRLFKKNINSGAGAFSELYHANGATAGYDSLDRLVEFRRGTLSNSGSTPDTVTMAARQQGWTLDALGNWSSLQSNGGTPVSRTHNAQNQVTANGGTSLTYDNNGNLKTGSGANNAYDAWNRLYSVGVANGRYFLYDAMNRRIHEFSAADNIQYGAGGPYQRTNLYYSTDWRVLEEDSNNDALDKFTQVQNVWSPLYIDAMVLRDVEITESGGGGRGLPVVDEELQKRLELLRADPRFAFAAGVPRPKIVENDLRTNTTRGGIIPPAAMNVPTVAGRVYVEQDANWNVTSITDTSGTVLERYVYDPYGTSTRLTAAWGTAGTDTYVMAWRHQGGRQDAASGLVNFRHRDLDTLLGRWVQVDPERYVDGANFYLYGKARSTSLVDPMGFGAVAPAGAPTLPADGDGWGPPLPPFFNPLPKPNPFNPAGIPLPPPKPPRPDGPTIGPWDGGPKYDPNPNLDPAHDFVEQKVYERAFKMCVTATVSIPSKVAAAFTWIFFHPSPCANSDTITGPYAPKIPPATQATN